jgi:hypothetical protein
MQRNYTKTTLALCGVPLGGYLIVLALTTQLSSPNMNNFILVLGLLMFLGCGLYLIVRIGNKLTK